MHNMPPLKYSLSGERSTFYIKQGAEFVKQQRNVLEKITKSLFLFY